jgi:hypothetical protein
MVWTMEVLSLTNVAKLIYRATTIINPNYLNGHEEINNRITLLGILNNT